MNEMGKETIEKMGYCGSQWIWDQHEKGEG